MTTEKYLKREDIQDVNATINDMLTELREMTQAETDIFEVHQVCMQLNENKHLKAWKMFVYFDCESGTFYYSYQDEDCIDTDFIRDMSFDNMVAEMEAEIEPADFEWIELV